MPYKTVPTKICSECGQVLESEVQDYCDGCNIRITQEDFEKHIRIGFLMKDKPEEYQSRRDDMVFHSLECFLRNIGKIDLIGVETLSIEYIYPEMFEKIQKLLTSKEN